MTLSRRTLVLSALALPLLAGCSSFRTWYDDPVPADLARAWRVVDVRVSVPQSLVVSEEKSLMPSADIVWREDPATGDRHEQVAVIVRNAARKGAAGLRGPRPVYLDLTVTRFHALTFEAETRLSSSGVHNIDFTAQVVDARSGQVLFGPEKIEAALPALSGAQMREARARGETQKSQISAHLSRTIAGWLGTGPDVRGGFTRNGI